LLGDENRDAVYNRIAGAAAKAAKVLVAVAQLAAAPRAGK
jgi:hypothetical protein